MSSKKYQSEILQEGDNWTARITRQVTSRKSLISKQQDGFNSEAEASVWAAAALADFISTQKSANTRQTASRKNLEEVKRQRSSRRAEKTEAAKRKKAESVLANQINGKQKHDDSDFQQEFESYED